jgi:STAS domain
MSVGLGHTTISSASLPDRAAAAPVKVAACVLRPSSEQARLASRFVPSWLDQVRNSGTRHVVIDMSEVHGLDISGFGVLLAKLRDALDVTVSLTDVGVSEAASLASMDLIDDVAV